MGNAEPDRLASVDGTRYTVWKRFFIRDRKGGVYLRRLRVIQTPYWSIYLHHIDGPDPDPQPHDHPWNFISIVLRGGYVEEVYTHQVTNHGEVQSTLYTKPRVRKHLPFSIHFMPAASKAHKIISVKKNCTTLILAGRRQRDWGFWTSRGWVQWKQYLDETYGSQTTRRKEPLP